MADRESVVVDYMGIGDAEAAERRAEERVKLVKPMASLVVVDSRSGAISENDHDNGRPLLNLGPGSANNPMPQIISRVPSSVWTGVRVEDVDKAGPGGRMVGGRPGEGKLLEELSAAEIANLSGDDCRRMLQMIKGAAGTSAVKPPTGQPKTLVGMSPGEAKIRTWALATRNGQPEASTTQQSGVDTGRLPSNLTMRFQQPPRHGFLSFTPSEVHEGARLAERAVPEPSLSLSTPSAHDQSVAQAAPPLLKMIRQPDILNRNPQISTQAGQSAIPQSGAVSRIAGQTHLPGRPPTAQLTIFYAGRANVYDDVPADKAEAIMLLAGSGSSWSSINPPPSIRAAGQGAVASSQQALPVAIPIASQAGAALQGVPTVASLVPTISAARADAPLARKKSLARFLENRKDRVRARSPYDKSEVAAKKSGEISNPPGKEKSPSPGTAKVRTRSPSPAQAPVPTVAVTRSPSPAQRI